MTTAIRRLQILEDLRHLGISGREANFLELVPLVEMLWADGQAQQGELAVLDQYIERLVKRLNALDGAATFTGGDARDFAMRFLRARPSPELMRVLRGLAIELATAEARELLLQACLDIASSAVGHYPYGVDERFDPAEKRTFFEILSAAEA